MLIHNSPVLLPEWFMIDLHFPVIAPQGELWCNVIVERRRPMLIVSWNNCCVLDRVWVVPEIFQNVCIWLHVLCRICSSQEVVHHEAACQELKAAWYPTEQILQRQITLWNNTLARPRKVEAQHRRSKGTDIEWEEEAVVGGEWASPRREFCTKVSNTEQTMHSTQRRSVSEPSKLHISFCFHWAVGLSWTPPTAWWEPQSAANSAGTQK